MQNIMFVCTGNICRSAMAEGIMKKLLKDKNINNIEVYSAGIYAEIGGFFEGSSGMMRMYVLAESEPKRYNDTIDNRRRNKRNDQSRKDRQA